MATDFYVNVNGQKVLYSSLNKTLQKQIANREPSSTPKDYTVNYTQTAGEQIREWENRDHIVGAVSVPGRYADKFKDKPTRKQIKDELRKEEKRLEEEEKEKEEKRFQFSIHGDGGTKKKGIKDLSPKMRKSVFEGTDPLFLAKQGYLAPSTNRYFRGYKKVGDSRTGFFKTSVYKPELQKAINAYILKGDVKKLNKHLAKVAKDIGPREAMELREQLINAGFEHTSLELYRQKGGIGTRKQRKLDKQAKSFSSQQLRSGQAELSQKYGALLSQGQSIINPTSEQMKDYRVVERGGSNYLVDQSGAPASFIETSSSPSTKKYTLGGKELSPDDPRIEKRDLQGLIGERYITLDGEEQLLDSSSAIVLALGAGKFRNIDTPGLFQQSLTDRNLEVTPQAQKLIDLHTTQSEAFSFVRSSTIYDPQTGKRIKDASGKVISDTRGKYDGLTGQYSKGESDVNTFGQSKISEALGQPQQIQNMEQQKFTEREQVIPIFSMTDLSLDNEQRETPFNEAISGAYASLLSKEKRFGGKSEDQFLLSAGKVGLSIIGSIINTSEQIGNKFISDHRDEIARLAPIIPPLGLVLSPRWENYVPPKPITFASTTGGGAAIDSLIESGKQSYASNKLVVDTTPAKEYIEQFGYKPFVYEAGLELMPGVGSVPSLVKGGIRVGGKLTLAVAPKTTVKLSSEIKSYLKFKPSPALTVKQPVKIYPEISTQMRITPAMISDAKNIMRQIKTSPQKVNLLTSTKVAQIKNAFGVGSKSSIQKGDRTTITGYTSQPVTFSKAPFGHKVSVQSKGQPVEFNPYLEQAEIRTVLTRIGSKDGKIPSRVDPKLYKGITPPEEQLFKSTALPLGKSSSTDTSALLFSARKGENLEKAVQAIHGQPQALGGSGRSVARPQFGSSDDILKSFHKEPFDYPRKPLTDLQKFWGIKTPIEGEIKLSSKVSELINKAKYDKLVATEKPLVKSQGMPLKFPAKTITKEPKIVQPAELDVFMKKGSTQDILRRGKTDVLFGKSGVLGEVGDFIGPMPKPTILGKRFGGKPVVIGAVDTFTGGEKILIGSKVAKTRFSGVKGFQALTKKTKPKLVDDTPFLNTPAETRTLFKKLGGKITVERPTGILGPVVAKQKNAGKLDPKLLEGVTPKEDIVIGMPVKKFVGKDKPKITDTDSGIELFHGTSPESAEAILKRGFAFRKSTSSKDTIFATTDSSKAIHELGVNLKITMTKDAKIFDASKIYKGKNIKEFYKTPREFHEASDKLRIKLKGEGYDMIKNLGQGGKVFGTEVELLSAKNIKSIKSLSEKIPDKIMQKTVQNDPTIPFPSVTSKIKTIKGEWKNPFHTKEGKQNILSVDKQYDVLLQEKSSSVPYSRIDSTIGKTSLRLTSKGKESFTPKYPKKIDKDLLQPKGEDVLDPTKFKSTKMPFYKYTPVETKSGKFIGRLFKSDKGKSPLDSKRIIDITKGQKGSRPKLTKREEKRQTEMFDSADSKKVTMEFEKTMAKKRDFTGQKRADGTGSYSKAEQDKIDLITKQQTTSSQKQVESFIKGKESKKPISGGKRPDSQSKVFKGEKDRLALETKQKQELEDKAIKKIQEDLFKKTGSTRSDAILRKLSKQSKKSKSKSDEWDIKEVKKSDGETVEVSKGVLVKVKTDPNKFKKTRVALGLNEKAPKLLTVKGGLKVEPPKTKQQGAVPSILKPTSVKTILPLPKKPIKEKSKFKKPVFVATERKKKKSQYSLTFTTEEMHLSPQRPQLKTSIISSQSLIPKLITSQKISISQKLKPMTMTQSKIGSKQKSKSIVIPKLRIKSKQGTRILQKPKQIYKLKTEAILKPKLKTKQRLRHTLVPRFPTRVTTITTPVFKKIPILRTTTTPTILTPPQRLVPPLAGFIIDEDKKKKKKKGDGTRHDFWGATHESRILGWQKQDITYNKKKIAEIVKTERKLFGDNPLLDPVKPPTKKRIKKQSKEEKQYKEDLSLGMLNSVNSPTRKQAKGNLLFATSKVKLI